MRAALLGPLLLAVACSRDSSSTSAATQGAKAQEMRMVGVEPDDFRCDTVAPPEELAQILGARVRSIDSPITPPRGVARPCNYVVERGDAGVAAWTFDFDCRPQAIERAEALFAQYRETSAALVDDYNAARQAKKLGGRDGGPPPRAPEPAREVEVGAKALDHHGQGLLFVDDDTPCYVRVVGPDATQRLALATLLSKNLTLERAPMTPRAVPAK
jgi:hypothetical protein